MICSVWLQCDAHRGFQPQMTIDGGIHSLTIAPDGRFVANTRADAVKGGLNMAIRLIDLRTAEMVDIPLGFEEDGSVRGSDKTTISPDGATVAVGFGANRVQFWDLATRTVKLEARVAGNDFIVFDPSGKHVYVAARLKDGIIQCVDATTGRAERCLAPTRRCT